MMCGDRGHVTKAGTPCRQPINEAFAGCIHHTPDTTPEEKSRRAVGWSALSRLQRSLSASKSDELLQGLNTDTVEPQTIIRVLVRLARVALTEDLDMRRVNTARSILDSIVNVLAVIEQGRLTDAVLGMDYGGDAVIRLKSLLDRAKTKPSPARALVAAGGADA